MEINEYVIEFMMRNHDGNVNVVQNAYIIDRKEITDLK